MKKQCFAFVLLIAGIYTPYAAAGEWLVGAKAGVVDIDFSAADAGVGGSFMLGKEVIDLVAADIAIEGELTESLSDPEIGNSEISFSSKALYASLRTAGPIYVIGKLGVASAEFENTDDTGSSLGVGVGFSLGGLRWEVEYTTFEVENTDVNYITLGLSF